MVSMSVWVDLAYAVLIRCSLPDLPIGTHRSRGIDSMSIRSLPGSMRAIEMLSDRCPPVSPPSIAPAPGEPFFTPARLSEPTMR